MPPPSSGFQKASLEIDAGSTRETLACWFNPRQYSIAKTNTYAAKPQLGASLPYTEFGGGNARTLSVELLFDAPRDGDVSTATHNLLNMMEANASLVNAS